MNWNIPVSRLPNELLMIVFVFARDTMDPRDGHWITFTWVCQRWRYVALATTELWSDIRLVRSIPFMLASLERARSLVSLSVPEKFDDIRALAKVLQAHRHRFKSLQVMLDQQRLRMLFEALTMTMSNLEALHILGPTYLPYEDFSEIDLEWPGASWPRLKTLRLKVPDLPFKPCLFSSVVNLEWGTSFPGSSRVVPSIDTLLTILQESPQLESAKLFRCWAFLPSDTRVYPDPGRIVTLPNLVSLKLEHTPLDVAHLLAHFSLPSALSVEIDGSDLEEPILVKKFRLRREPDFPYLSTAQELEIEGTPNSVVIRTFVDVHHVRRKFQLVLPGARRDSTTFGRVVTVLSTFSVAPQSLRRLGMKGHLSSIFLKRWRVLLARFPDLQVLELHDSPREDENEVKWYDRRDVELKEDRFTRLCAALLHPLCPCLNDLVIATRTNINEATIRELVVLLTSRKKMGIPLKVLTIQDQVCRTQYKTDNDFIMAEE